MSSVGLGSVGDLGSGKGDKASSQSRYSVLNMFVLKAAWLCGDIEV